MKPIGYLYLIENFKLNVYELQSRVHLTDKSVLEVHRQNNGADVYFVKNNRGRVSAAKRHFFAELADEEVCALEQVVCPSEAVK